jgi:hypothetical protein
MIALLGVLKDQGVYRQEQSEIQTDVILEAIKKLEQFEKRMKEINKLNVKGDVFMSYVELIKKAGLGATVAVGTVIALPIAGAVGTITATGATVAVIVGATAGAVDYINENSLT